MDLKAFSYDYLPQSYRYPEFAAAVQAFQGSDFMNLSYNTEFQQQLIPVTQNLIPPEFARLFAVPTFAQCENDLNDQRSYQQYQQQLQQQQLQQQQLQQAVQQQQLPPMPQSPQHTQPQQQQQQQQMSQPQYSAGWNPPQERGTTTATSQLQPSYTDRPPGDASRMQGQMPSSTGMDRMQQPPYPGMLPMLDPPQPAQGPQSSASGYAGAGPQMSMAGPGTAPIMPNMPYPRGYGYPEQPQSFMPPYYFSNPSMAGLQNMPPGPYPYPAPPGPSYLSMPMESQQQGTSKATEMVSAPKPSDCQDLDDGDDAARALKRPRLVWTPQLHKRFEESVQKIGVDKAVPKTIMKIMNVEGLTRENIASHLQKYRLQMKRGGPETSDAHGASARGSPECSEMNGTNGADS